MIDLPADRVTTWEPRASWFDRKGLPEVGAVDGEWFCVWVDFEHGRAGWRKLEN